MLGKKRWIIERLYDSETGEWSRSERLLAQRTAR